MCGVKAVAGGKQMKPQRCPFCRSSVSLIDSAQVFGCGYGFIHLCNAYPKCDARMGCHPRTIIALGTLADKELRRWYGFDLVTVWQKDGTKWYLWQLARP